jgi:hypothetical protein
MTAGGLGGTNKTVIDPSFDRGFTDADGMG